MNCFNPFFRAGRQYLLLTGIALVSAIGQPSAQAQDSAAQFKLVPVELRMYTYMPAAKERCEDKPLVEVFQRQGPFLVRRVFSPFEVRWAKGSASVVSARHPHEDLGDKDARPSSGQCFILDHGDRQPIRGTVLSRESARLLTTPVLVVDVPAGEQLRFRLLPRFPATLEDPAPELWSETVRN